MATIVIGNINIIQQNKPKNYYSVYIYWINPYWILHLKLCELYIAFATSKLYNCSQSITPLCLNQDYQNKNLTDSRQNESTA